MRYAMFEFEFQSRSIIKITILAFIFFKLPDISVRIVKNELGGSVTQRVSRGPEKLGGSQWWDQRNWGG